MKIALQRSLIPALLILVIVAVVGYLASSRSRLFDSTKNQTDNLQLEQLLSPPNTGFIDLTILKNGRIIATSVDDRESKFLYLSDNGGRSWRTVTLPVGRVEGISFVDETHGWLVGYGVVLETEDGGDTWSQISKPTNYPLSHVKFINSEVGFAGGGAERGCQILSTLDGGKTWRRIYENLEDGTLFDLVALDRKTIIAAVNDSFLLRSADGGTTWQKIQLDTKGACSLSVVPGEGIWVVGSKGSFHYSTDGGQTWKRPVNLANSFFNVDWESISFIDGNRGMAIGKKNIILVTRDGGVSWKELEISVSDAMRKIRFDGTKAFIVGSHAIYKLAFPPA